MHPIYWPNVPNVTGGKISVYFPYKNIGKGPALQVFEAHQRLDGAWDGPRGHILDLPVPANNTCDSVNDRNAIGVVLVMIRPTALMSPKI
jgi:hypothetical protein